MVKRAVKTYVITAAQACAAPNSNFLTGLEYCTEQMNAELKILPMIGKSAAEDWVEENFHRRIREHRLEYDKFKINNNVQIEQFNIRPYAIEPLTGLYRFAQRETTLIFASPKQHWRPVAHSNKKHPKFLVTTGACTQPNYVTTDSKSAERRRLGDIARRDHVYGAMIIEVEDEEIFHMRPIRANSEGKFVDLGVMYDGKETSESKLEAMVLGDYHMGWTDPQVRNTTLEIIKEMKPERLILHDFFDGHSVSHHIEQRYIEYKLIQQADRGHQYLERELKEGTDELLLLSELMEGRKIYIAPSNHHEFLHRYLNECRFTKDPPNARFGFILAGYFAEKDYNNPVEAGYNMVAPKKKLPKNIIFLRRDQDFKVRGYQLGSHGDKGPGLGYASMNSKENDWGKSITGHVHKAQIMRNTYTVGAMLPLSPYYMRGSPTDFSHSHAFLWDNGTVQLINIIDGKWRADPPSEPPVYRVMRKPIEACPPERLNQTIKELEEHPTQLPFSMTDE